MPSFLHKTLRRSSYLLNVLEGSWLPNIKNTQFIFNYGTSLEIFKFIPPNLLESVYFQPFFDRVRFICSGLHSSERSIFYALRENDIIEYTYQESEGFFIALNKFILPSSCNNPSFAVYTQTHLIVSSTNGYICSINLKNKQIITIKPSECILHSIVFSSKQFLLRIESGPKISIYSIPDMNLVKTTHSNDIKYSFPYRDGSYVLFQTNDSVGNVSFDPSLSENETNFPNFQIIFPNGSVNLLDYPLDLINKNEKVIDNAVISANSTIILTENGHLLQLINDEFQYIGVYPHSYRIFALNATEILIARHGLDYIILDLLEKNVACQKESISTVLNFTFLGGNKKSTTDMDQFNTTIENNNFPLTTNIEDSQNNNNNNNFNSLLIGPENFKFDEPINRIMLTMTSSSFISSRFGIEVDQLSSFETNEDEITGLFSFTHMIRAKTLYAISFASGCTQVLELSEDNVSLHVSNDPVIRTDVKTLGFCSLDPYFLFHFHNEGFTTYSQTNKHDRRLDDSSIISFSSTRNELIIILSNQTAFYAVSGKSELHLSHPFYLPFEATCAAVVEDTEFTLFAAKDMNLYAGSLSIETQSNHFNKLSKLPAIPVSLKFTPKKKLMIGFDDGTVAVGSFDKKSMQMRDTIILSIGKVPVLFSNDNIFAISSRMYKIEEKSEEFVDFVPINNDTNPLFAVSMNFGKYLMASKHKIYAMEIKNDQMKMQNKLFGVKNTIIECIPIGGLNSSSAVLVATNKDVSIFDIKKLTIRPLFEYKDTEKFILMSQIKDANQICVVTQVDQTSFIRMVNFTNNKKLNYSISLDLEISGRINSVCGFKGGILIGVGNSILFYKMDQNDNCYHILSRTSEIGTEIVSIIANEDFIFVGDRRLSVLILEYVESFQNFRVVGQEAALRRILSLTGYTESVVGSDINGNVFTFGNLSKIVADLSASFPLFKGNRRLPLRMCYNVGEVVTKVASIDDNDNEMAKIVYTTVNGGFGAFLEKIDNSFSHKMNLEEKFKTLLSLQTIIEVQLLKVAEIDHFAFRNKMFPSEVVLDLDIVNMYLHFSSNKKERVAKEVSSSLNTVKIEALINLANQLFHSIC